MKLTKITSLVALCLVSASAYASPLFDQYGFDAASQAHANAQTVDAARALQTVGTYKMIATASRSYKGDFVKKDLNGIANPDQSVLGLQISAQSTGSLVQVIQTNLSQRNQNQGPSVIVILPTGSMAFAQLSYRNGQVSNAVFFYSECKVLEDNTLLCAKRFMVQDTSQVNPQQAAMNNTIVGYDLYTR